MWMRRRRASGLARALGWFSIALGVSEIVAPGWLSRSLGLRRTRLVRAFGFRELGTGIAILASRRYAPWLWGRVAGDVLDLGLLGTALRKDNGQSQRRFAKAAIAAVAGVTALDLLSAGRHTDGAMQLRR